MPNNTITAAARISETVWVQLKIMARKENRTMNDLIGQALTEWLRLRQAKDNDQQTEKGKKELEEQAEIERMKLMRKKGRPVLDDKNKKWLRDKAGRMYRNRFWVPKEKASGK
ncbi:MAG: hypothetical protein NT106_13290 [Candidatus Sumerlaeota bacterium]|nr:hypothetical protein [Candidatus Sumerlaeota bacterium]